MGKGDKKSKRGKIIMGSYGVRRPQKTHASPVNPTVKEEKPAAKVKAPAAPKAPKSEAQIESPVVAAVEDAVKPAKKKTAPKASSKKEEKAEE
jgi:30S ribosomal protein S31